MTEFSTRNVQVRHPRLPWIIGAVAFLIYVLTLNHGVSLRGLPLTAEMAGWVWQPKSDQPLLTLAYLPMQCLPAAWVPPALNLLSALTAALTLAVLARSVQLLPLNRLRIQRMFVRNSLGTFSRHDSWVPAVVAVVVGGLELGFWQEATSASGEMLDLFLLATSVWCLLEFRQAGNERWLDRAAMVLGIGMAENWTMQLSLPLFLVGLIWLRGIKEIRVLFLCRMALLCLSAFLGILLLSLADNLLLHAYGATGQTLAESLRGLSQSIFPAHLGFWEQNPLFTLLVLLYFLLAALPMSLHLKHEGSYHFSLQARTQLLVFELLYGACLLGSLWLALEPNGGPQAMSALHYSSLPPLLSLTYLNALGAGYYTAHFLLIFGADWASIRRHDARFRPPPFMPHGKRPHQRMREGRARHVADTLHVALPGQQPYIADVKRSDRRHFPGHFEVQPIGAAGGNLRQPRGPFAAARFSHRTFLPSLQRALSMSDGCPDRPRFCADAFDHRLRSTRSQPLQNLAVCNSSDDFHKRSGLRRRGGSRASSPR